YGGAVGDLCLDRCRVRGGDAWAAGYSARPARRGTDRRRERSRHHGAHRAGLGAAGVVLAPHRGAPLPAGEVLIRILAAGVLLAVVPFLGLPAFYESFLYLIFHWVVLATSWNILSGYSGYFSFGHGAFFGAGMYTTATLATKADVPFLLTLPLAALVAAAFGIALGAVVFRLPRLVGVV